MALPSNKTKPVTNLWDQVILLYGPPKFGKTTFCAQIPDVVFAAFEPGLKALSVYAQPMTNWQDFLDFCKDVAKMNHPFKVVAIDTIDLAYDRCMEHVCKEMGITHPQDAGHGKGWSAIKNEFRRVLTKLASLDIGVIMTSHAKEEDMQTPAGEMKRTMPSFGKQARDVVNPMADLILCGQIELVPSADGKEWVEKRMIRTKPSATCEAGERCEQGKARLPEMIEFGFDSLKAAWEKGGKK